MSVSATEAVGLMGPATTGTTSSPGLGDKDTFLKLLAAQLKYQDPMNPADSTQFLSQTAQFTALEKMQSVADQSSQMVAAQLAFGASGLVGRTVTYTLPDGSTGSGVVDKVDFTANGPTLDVNGVTVSLGAVKAITAGTPAPTDETD